MKIDILIALSITFDSKQPGRGVYAPRIEKRDKLDYRYRSKPFRTIQAQETTRLPSRVIAL